MPERIQRKRTKGWKAPEGVVYVGRGSRWGNPFIVDEKAKVSNRTIAVSSFCALLKESGAWSSIPTSKWPAGTIPRLWTTIEDVKRELRGKDLMCWCPLVDKDGNRAPCHADVLLRLANV